MPSSELWGVRPDLTTSDRRLDGSPDIAPGWPPSRQLLPPSVDLLPSSDQRLRMGCGRSHSFDFTGLGRFLETLGILVEALCL